MQNKLCNVCLKEKPINEFYTREVDGRRYPRTKCKLCDNAKRLEWGNNNREKYREYKRAYYHKHK